MNIYDYGARNYDPQLGRFFNIDRFSEKYMSSTPYHYTLNNPIKYVDINGDSVNVSESYNEETKTRNVNIYFEYAVKNSSKDKINMNVLLTAINSQLLNTYLKNEKDGESGVTTVVNLELKGRVLGKGDKRKKSEHLIEVKDAKEPAFSGFYGSTSGFGGTEITLGSGAVKGIVAGADLVTVPHEVGHAFGLIHPDERSSLLLDSDQYIWPWNRGKNKYKNNVMWSEESGRLNNQTSTEVTLEQIGYILKNFNKGRLNQRPFGSGN